MPKIGVLALQGDVSEHVDALQRIPGGLDVLVVRKPGQIASCSALVLPGGESTTIVRQLNSSGLAGELVAAATTGMPILATCAGLVLISREIEGGDNHVQPLGLMDIKISRNAFGPQRESFEADLDVEGMDRPYRAVFIRAPAVSEVGRGVQVLAKVGGLAVAVQEKNLLGLAFHPELTDDMRFHQLFLKMLEA
ncbi:pyridoxal 5'-phosphate synthase glutaminase subunit PdxT [Methanothrix sp.]|uniref:pyridoxal 5'-phosphate synthase glutaminase subunit PdxT n=1 Tax=Methanothrix sp. TaxID=90426 RepID=UPI003BB7520B